MRFIRYPESYVVMLHELGFHFTKVGEAGVVDQATEDLSPAEVKQLRISTFDEIGIPFCRYDQLQEELHQAVKMEVSQNGFQGAREKYFSVGRFDKSYVRCYAVSVLSVKIKKSLASLTAQPMTKKQKGW